MVNVDGVEWEREQCGANAKRAFRVGAQLTAPHTTQLDFELAGVADRWTTGFGRDGTIIAFGGTVPGEADVPSGLQNDGP